MNVREEPPMTGRISIVVTTYDRDDALDAVLRALSRQDDTDFEVVVADDGSGPATKALIDSWTSRFPAPLRHVWQAHNGFRAAEVRNRAIVASTGDYVVFLDGDCLPRRDFVAAHRALAEPGWFVAGNRILLSRTLTEDVLRNRREPETWSLGAFVRERLRGGINRLLPLVRFPIAGWRKAVAHRWEGCRSCNLAVWRQDLDRVDGFDAAFMGWGKEDSDLVVRLLHAGVRRKDGRFATGVLHLWHAPEDRSRLPENETRLGGAIGSARVRAEQGLSSLQV
jgi:glycosyltransferase involved in cell wall biosynthesis